MLINISYQVEMLEGEYDIEYNLVWLADLIFGHAMLKIRRRNLNVTLMPSPCNVWLSSLPVHSRRARGECIVARPPMHGFGGRILPTYWQCKGFLFTFVRFSMEKIIQAKYSVLSNRTVSCWCRSLSVYPSSHRVITIVSVHISTCHWFRHRQNATYFN